MLRDMSLEGVGVRLVLERQSGERVTFDRLPISVGRRGYNDLTVRDPRVSSEHCVIELSSAPPLAGEAEAGEPRLTIRDLNSRNGTLLKRDTQELIISSEQPTPLQRGDECWLGDRRDPVRLTLVELCFTFAPEPAQAPCPSPQSETADSQRAFEALISELEALDEPRALLKRALERAQDLGDHNEALSDYLGARLTSTTHHEALRRAAEELVHNHERLKRAFEAQRAELELAQEGERSDDLEGLDEPSRAQLLRLPLEQLITLELPLKTLIATFEERVIRARLERCDDNRTHTAQSLELSRQALQGKLAKWRELSDEPDM